MPLNLTSRLQVTAHHFWNRRNAAALSHHGVRLEYDPEQRRSAALILGFTFTILAVALMFILSWFKPAGQVGSSAILADRDTGAIYVLVDGRLHPALSGNDKDRSGVARMSSVDHSGPHCSQTHRFGGHAYPANRSYTRSILSGSLTRHH